MFPCYLYYLFPIGIFLGLIFRDNITNTCKKINMVYQLMPTNNKGRMCTTLTKGVMNVIYIKILQYFNSTIKRVKNGYEITYVIGRKPYKLVVKPKRGPPPVLQIINDKNEDVTDEIIPYMGPRYDWHGTKFSPNYFNYETITFNDGDGGEVFYGRYNEFRNYNLL